MAPVAEHSPIKTHWVPRSAYEENNYTTICGWDYTSCRHELEHCLNKAIYNSHVPHMRACTDCWKQRTAPDGWSLPDHWETIVSSDGDSADSPNHDSSDDEPDSDDDDYVLPEAMDTDHHGTDNTNIIGDPPLFPPPDDPEFQPGPHDDAEQNPLLLPDTGQG